MAPPGLLMLMMLMMSSHRCIFTTSQPSPNVEKIKKLFELIEAHSDKISKAVNFFLDVLNIGDPRIKTAIDVISSVLTGGKPEDEVLTTVVNEFQNLNHKLDRYYKELKWDSWASGAFHKPEVKIKEGLTIFKTLLGSLAETKNATKRQKYINEFTTSYRKYEPATRRLREYLIAEGPTMINNLGLMLAEHLKCDQNDTKEYSEYIHTLVFEGNFLNQIYYHLTETDSSAKRKEAAKIQYDVASAIFQMQKYCINQIMDYVEEDVMSLIDKNKDRTKLAKDIRKFLENKDNKYEWMVVTFNAKNSEHSFFKIGNKHTLTGFTVVTKDGVSVGVARQLKGKHTEAGKIIEAIKKCFKKSPLCYKVEKELSKCKEKVHNLPVSLTYTAVLAYHESHTEVSSSKDNIYQGDCLTFGGLTRHPFKGKFEVLLKRDDEITKSTCSELQCGTEEQGQCVTAGSPLIAMCECNYPYYGKNCEEELNDHKNS